MYKSLSIALTLTFANAQAAEAEAGIAKAANTIAGSCCPSVCPSFQSQQCCQSCPKLCLTPPEQSAPIEARSLDDSCKKTQLTWLGSPSCAELKKTELQCLGNDGDWYAMPEVGVKATALTVNNELFANPPFNLKGDSNLYCQVRSSSKWGWGVWSPSNDVFGLPNCSTPQTIDPLEMEEEEELVYPCACNSSCKSFGCGGCCGAAQPSVSGSFWGKVAQKSCCKMGTCNCGKPQDVPAYSLNAKRHEHKYCHVDKAPRFVKKTKWVTKTIKGKRTVLEPRIKKVIETIMVTKMQKVPDVVYQPQEVIMKKKVMKDIVNRVPRSVKKNRMVQKAMTTYVDEPYTEQVTRMKSITKKVKKVRFVPTVVDVQELQFDQQTNIEKKSKWVAENVLSTRVVQAASSCGCYKQNCDCLGQQGCGCCYPSCGCAPRQNFQTVQVLSQQQVERPYEVETVVRKPKVVTVKRTIQQPEVYYEDETVQEPYLETITKVRKIPQVTYRAVNEEYTDYEYDNVAGQREFEEDIKSIVTVPRSIMTSVEVEHPEERQMEITEQIAVVRSVDLDIRVPITIIERLPEPPCHWHTNVHSHEVVDGQTHTHTEDHDHN